MNYDRIQNKLEVGDEVVYLSHSRTSSCLERGLIVGFTKCFVKLCVHHPYKQGEWVEIKVSHDKTVKIPEDVR